MRWWATCEGEVDDCEVLSYTVQPFGRVQPNVPGEKLCSFRTSLSGGIRCRWPNQRNRRCIKVIETGCCLVCCYINTAIILLLRLQVECVLQWTAPSGGGHVLRECAPLATTDVAWQVQGQAHPVSARRHRNHHVAERGKDIDNKPVFVVQYQCGIGWITVCTGIGWTAVCSGIFWTAVCSGVSMWHW